MILPDRVLDKTGQIRSLKVLLSGKSIIRTWQMSSFCNRSLANVTDPDRINKNCGKLALCLKKREEKLPANQME